VTGRAFEARPIEAGAAAALTAPIPGLLLPRGVLASAPGAGRAARQGARCWLTADWATMNLPRLVTRTACSRM